MEEGSPIFEEELKSDISGLEKRKMDKILKNKKLLLSIIWQTKIVKCLDAKNE